MMPPGGAWCIYRKVYALKVPLALIPIAHSQCLTAINSLLYMCRFAATLDRRIGGVATRRIEYGRFFGIWGTVGDGRL
jgi:hypothetical protein